MVTPATIPGQKVVVPKEQFYQCLNEWFLTDLGRNQKQNIAFNEEGKITGWRQYVTPIRIDDVYIDGPNYLNDVR